MKTTNTNSNYSLIRHHSAPSSVLQGLLNDEDHDLLYKFNPPAPGHGGSDDNQWSSLLDIDSDYTNLIANMDNIVPYPLPSISEQDDTNNNQGMLSPGPHHHDYILSSNDSRNSNNTTMDMKRRRRRRKPPLPSPSPSPSSGHELIRHSSSPAHLLSRIAMEEMHEMEMEMEMEMEKKKKNIVPTMNISLL